MHAPAATVPHCQSTNKRATRVLRESEPVHGVHWHWPWVDEYQTRSESESEPANGIMMIAEFSIMSSAQRLSCPAPREGSLPPTPSRLRMRMLLIIQ